MTVQDFLAAIGRGEIIVNRHYQRSDQVWPDAARSYLIETVILDFPIPKLFLHLVTDPKTGESHKELVDGQQRSGALRAFRANEFRLSSAVEDPSVRGKNFDDLTIEQRTTFQNYQLSIDTFLGAEASQIREVFRRINSYTVPLNFEEQRHAQYQGAFKWFLHRLALRWNEGWESMGIFSEKQIVRMADTKLLAEVSHAIFNGIVTTNKRSLDLLYKSHDDKFTEEKRLESRLSGALDVLVRLPDLHQTSLMKPFQVYAILLAATHVTRPVTELQSVFRVDNAIKIDIGASGERLLRLLQAVDDEVKGGKYAKFVKASAEKTNVKFERETRFRYFCEAFVG